MKDHFSEEKLTVVHRKYAMLSQFSGHFNHITKWAHFKIHNHKNYYYI